MAIEKTPIRFIEHRETISPSVTNRPFSDIETNIDAIIAYVNGKTWQGGTFTSGVTVRAQDGIGFPNIKLSDELSQTRGELRWNRTTNEVQLLLHDPSTLGIDTELSVRSGEVLIDTYPIWHSGNFDPATKTDKATEVIAGDGLVGGGDLSGNVTVTLGEPHTISLSSTNSVLEDGHTHTLLLNASDIEQILGYVPVSTDGDLITGSLSVTETVDAGRGEFDTLALGSTQESRNADTIFYSSSDNDIKKNTAEGMRASMDVPSNSDLISMVIALG